MVEIKDITLVTILILIDGFLQFFKNMYLLHLNKCHNPYFNRWFSAIVFMAHGGGLKGLSQSLF